MEILFTVSLPVKEQRLLFLEHQESNQRHHQERNLEKRNCKGVDYIKYNHRNVEILIKNHLNICSGKAKS